MTGHDKRRRTAMLNLPALPRALFLFHNFYGVDIGAMAQELGTDGDTINACLADARARVRAHVCYMDPVPDIGSATAALQARLQQDYRQSIAAAFAESGYPGDIAWPGPIADIAADQEAAAAFLVAQLPTVLRKAAQRSRRAGVATIDQWRFVGPWRRRRRKRLLCINDALRCAGWQPFDEWLADRLLPDHRYPHGYAEYRRQRRPLPVERQTTVVDTIQVPERQTGQPALSQQVWVLFHHYGRSYEEIARYLCISRASVKRRRTQAWYAILGETYPSLASRIRFNLMVKRLSFEWRWEIIRSALYG
jgi:DNA-directed RNA polymerase specialized sigma24 family protein